MGRPGTVTRQDVPSLQLSTVAAAVTSLPPPEWNTKLTLVPALAKPVPVSVIAVPAGPVFGLSFNSAGGRYVNCVALPAGRLCACPTVTCTSAIVPTGNGR